MSEAERDLNVIGAGAQGRRTCKGRWAEFFVSVVGKEDLRETFLPTASEADRSKLVYHIQQRVHRMFLPELTDEMWINCRDGMVPVASYERSHR